jgi:hypothetical protein
MREHFDENLGALVPFERSSWNISVALQLGQVKDSNHRLLSVSRVNLRNIIHAHSTVYLASIRVAELRS